MSERQEMDWNDATGMPRNTRIALSATWTVKWAQLCDSAKWRVPSEALCTMPGWLPRASRRRHPSKTGDVLSWNAMGMMKGLTTVMVTAADRRSAG